MENHLHHHLRELHLFPIPQPPLPLETSASHHHYHHHSFDYHAPPLDLQLSINLGPCKPPTPPESRQHSKLLRRQAAKQMRLAVKERAYVEWLRQMAKREKEKAQSELTRAQILWDRTTEELARAERIKLDCISMLPNYPPMEGSCSTNNTCMEITCHSCRRRFCPY